MGELQQNCPTVPSLIFQFVPREKFFNKYVTRITKVRLLLSNAIFSLASHLFLLPLCPSGTSCLSCQSKHLKYQLGPRVCYEKSTFFSRISGEEGKWKRVMCDQDNKFGMKHINRESCIWVIIQSVPTAFHTFFVFLVSPVNHPWPCPFSFSSSLVCLVFHVPHSPPFPVSAKICLRLVRHSIRASPLQFYFKNKISKNVGWIWYIFEAKNHITLKIWCFSSGCSNNRDFKKEGMI